MLAAEQFDYEFFMIWLLPPIIFEAGFNMNASSFFNNIGPTMFFAFIGTFASTFIVGGAIYAAGQAGLCYPLGLLACLVFGSLISATDPVTVLAVFQAPDSRPNPHLHRSGHPSPCTRRPSPATRRPPPSTAHPSPPA